MQTSSCRQHEYRWRGQLDWDEPTWQRTLDRPGTELWISWQHGQPTGFAELTGGAGEQCTTTRISYLGLLPEFRGLGLGGHLVADATRRAWTLHLRHAGMPAVEHVELDTSTLDSEGALPNYYKRGYHLVREEQRDVSERIPEAVLPFPSGR